MPNTGRPSGACHACKRMKVRCPEEKPACSRCIRANRLCPGYGPTAERFRYEDPANRVKPAKASEDLDVTPATSSRSESVSTSTSTDVTSPSTAMVQYQEGHSGIELHRMSTDWEKHAFQFFIHAHALPGNIRYGYGTGFMDFLDDIVLSRNLPSYLEDSFRAAALTSIAHRTNIQWLPAKAMSSRLSALAALRQALGNEMEAKSDEVLMSLFLLEHFEVSLLSVF